MATWKITNSMIDAISSSKLTGALAAVNGSNLTSLPAASLSGTLPAVSGVNLTSLNASNLASRKTNTLGFVIPLWGLNSNTLNQASFFEFISTDFLK